MSGIKNVANLSLDSIKVNSIDADMVLISASPPTHPPTWNSSEYKVKEVEL